MTIKKSLENHIAIVVLSSAAVAFGLGWAACENARVTNKTEKIAELERKNNDQLQQIKELDTTKPLGVIKLAELQEKIRGLETELSNSKGNLNQGQESLQLLKDSNTRSQSILKLAASNCSVLSLIQTVEAKKDSIENSLENAYHLDREKPRIEDYKRQVNEYQARLLSLNEKLVCIQR
jgi:chromosome segregation ATPase